MSGGNLYNVHPLMIDSGTFWRCDHGTTGFGKGLKWVGCKACAKANPKGYARFHNKSKRSPTTRRAKDK